MLKTVQNPVTGNWEPATGSYTPLSSTVANSPNNLSNQRTAGPKLSESLKLSERLPCAPARHPAPATGNYASPFINRSKLSPTTFQTNAEPDRTFLKA